MRVALIHNDTAGDEVYKTRDLERLFRNEGFTVDAFGARKRDVQDALAGNPSLLVAAGGDGTVAKVATAIHERARRTPMFILPMGTSNNIARSLGLRPTVPELVRALPRARSARLDVGMVSAPWGCQPFIEAAGFGFIGTMLERDGSLREQIARGIRALRRPFRAKPDRRSRAAAGVAGLVRRQAPVFCRLTADGEDLTGEYIAVEAMNTREIGPRVALAPTADAADQLLDLVLFRPEDRDELAEYVRSRDVAAPNLPGIRRRVRHAEISWPCAGGHLDDEPWPSTPHPPSRHSGNGAGAPVQIVMAGAVHVLLPP